MIGLGLRRLAASCEKRLVSFQFHWHLLDNFYSETFSAAHLFRTVVSRRIRRQEDSDRKEIWAADADFRLGLASPVEQRGQFAAPRWKMMGVRRRTFQVENPWKVVE